MPSMHNVTARRIAKKYGARYNRGQGPDIQTSREAIEVETANTVWDGFRQLQGFRKKVYIAGADKEALNAALKATKGTSIGVMSPEGEIVKPSSRR